MFARKLRIERVAADGTARLCPLKALDSFAMRNFTNDAVFDDTLPIEDGLLEAGYRVPLERLREALEDWMRRKNMLAAGETINVCEVDGHSAKTRYDMLKFTVMVVSTLVGLPLSR